MGCGRGFGGGFGGGGFIWFLLIIWLFFVIFDD